MLLQRVPKEIITRILYYAVQNDVLMVQTIKRVCWAFNATFNTHYQQILEQRSIEAYIDRHIELNDPKQLRPILIGLHWLTKIKKPDSLFCSIELGKKLISFYCTKINQAQKNKMNQSKSTSDAFVFLDFLQLCKTIQTKVKKHDYYQCETSDVLNLKQLVKKHSIFKEQAIRFAIDHCDKTIWIRGENHIQHIILDLIKEDSAFLSVRYFSAFVKKLKSIACSKENDIEDIQREGAFVALLTLAKENLHNETPNIIAFMVNEVVAKKHFINWIVASNSILELVKKTPSLLGESQVTTLCNTYKKNAVALYWFTRDKAYDYLCKLAKIYPKLIMNEVGTFLLERYPQENSSVAKRNLISSLTYLFKEDPEIPSGEDEKIINLVKTIKKIALDTEEDHLTRSAHSIAILNLYESYPQLLKAITIDFILKRLEQNPTATNHGDDLFHSILKWLNDDPHLLSEKQVVTLFNFLKSVFGFSLYGWGTTMEQHDILQKISKLSSYYPEVILKDAISYFIEKIVPGAYIINIVLAFNEIEFWAKQEPSHLTNSQVLDLLKRLKNFSHKEENSVNRVHTYGLIYKLALLYPAIVKQAAIEFLQSRAEEGSERLMNFISELKKS